MNVLSSEMAQAVVGRRPWQPFRKAVVGHNDRHFAEVAACGIDEGIPIAVGTAHSATDEVAALYLAGGAVDRWEDEMRHRRHDDAR